MSPKQVKDWLKCRITSNQGKNALIFLVFLGVSAIFWLVMTLNDEYQRDIKIPIELAELPDSVTILSSPPQFINVSVRDKGNVLARYQWGDISHIKINFSDLTPTDQNTLVLPQTQINSIIRKYFGATAQIVSVSPDSIALTYTTIPGIKLPVSLDKAISASTSPGYAVVGHPYSVPDSIVVYSTSTPPRNMSSVTIDHITIEDLTDTTRVKAKIKIPAGMRAMPATVTAVIPVERLERRYRDVTVKVVNAPRGKHVTVSPIDVRVVYLLPTSLIGLDNYPISVTADFRQSDSSSGSPKIPLEISDLPDYYHAPIIYRLGNTDIRLDSIDYVLQDNP